MRARKVKKIAKNRIFVEISRLLENDSPVF